MSLNATRKHSAALDELSDLFAEKLAAGGRVSFSPKGTSMLPMLRVKGDTVTLKAPPARFKTGMVALFVIKEEDGSDKYILHRLVKIKDGKLTFCGDHRKEHDAPVDGSAVIGVVESYNSRGREHSTNELLYRVYSRWMVLTARHRRAALAVQDFVYRLWKKARK